ncbi:hypothetical protein WJX72_000884 [[Myrmecia] bisecta]|uniref:dual-specificity kinase n=1 Tax=[Myrmecia] bisecta TaxID=41462 RepID=A0AAW1Q0A0_9CHLO
MSDEQQQQQQQVYGADVASARPLTMGQLPSLDLRKVREAIQQGENTARGARNAAQTTPRQMPFTARAALQSSPILQTRLHSRSTLAASPPGCGQPVGSAGAALALTPAQVLRQAAAQLTDHEQSEVLEYPLIYFIGRNANKVKGNPSSPHLNHGYDDERGDYLTVMQDHIGFRFEVQSVLGKGSFGQVLKCFDYKTRKVVAIKIIRNKKRFHQQALVEVQILEHLRHKDTDDTCNIVHLEEYFYFRNHLCISFELLSVNLYEFIKNNNFRGVSLGLIRRFATQMLVGLRFLRRQRIVHCDLKPENILLKEPGKSAIKIIDFGSSCFENERVYTYIQSRFYRSPEVILGLPYEMAIDMWSLGCILAELLTGYPLFPGENEQEQLLCMMEVLGLPDRPLLERASRRKMFFDSSWTPRIVANSQGRKRLPATKDLAQALRCTDAAFLSFLQGCLRWDPSERLTADQALQHAWISEAAPTSATHVGRQPGQQAEASGVHITALQNS